MSHTKGPWRHRGNYIFGADAGDGVARLVALGHETEASNARLIAAAPDLLAVAELILKEWEQDHSQEAKGALVARLSQYAKEARAAVTKAKGEAI